MKYREATEEEQKAWQEGDRTWWSERALHFVAIASAIQFIVIGMMMLSFWIIQVGVDGGLAALWA